MACVDACMAYTDDFLPYWCVRQARAWAMKTDMTRPGRHMVASVKFRTCWAALRTNVVFFGSLLSPRIEHFDETRTYPQRRPHEKKASSAFLATAPFSSSRRDPAMAMLSLHYRSSPSGTVLTETKCGSYIFAGDLLHFHACKFRTRLDSPAPPKIISSTSPEKPGRNDKATPYMLS